MIRTQNSCDAESQRTLRETRVPTHDRDAHAPMLSIRRWRSCVGRAMHGSGRQLGFQGSALLALLALLSLAIAGAPAAAGDVFEVRGLGGAGGMFVPSVSPYDPNLMLLACDMSGSYRSTDGGKTWALIHYREMSDNVSSAFPAYLPDKVYWNQGAALRVSADKGKTWRATAETFPWEKQAILYLAAFAGTPEAVFVGTDKGLWRSEDGGKAWTQVLAEGSRDVVALGDKLFTVSGANTLQSSTDGGKTWTGSKIEPAATNKVFGFTGGKDADGSVLFASAWKVGVLRSKDDGKTWQTMINKYEDQNILQMASNQTRIAYAAQSGGGWCKNVWSTADGGDTWNVCFRMGGADKNVELSWVQTQLSWSYYVTQNGFSSSRSDANFAMIATQGDLYFTRDGGKTWTQQMNEILRPQPGDPAIRYRCTGLEVTSCWGYAFDPFEKSREYIAYTDIGFGRTVDNGKTWSWGGKGSPWTNTFYDVIFDSEIKGRMYAACSNRHDIPHWTNVGASDPKKPSPHNVGGVCVTDDHAVTWKPLAGGLPKKPATSVCLDPTSPKEGRTLYATLFEEGVFRSTDGGANWVKKSNGLGNQGNMHVYRVRRHPKSGNLYCLITGCREGQRDFKVPGGIWKSADKAETWTDITSTLALVWPTNFAISPDDENTIYLTAATAPGKAQGGVYKTTDGGKTWKHILKDADFAKTGGSGFEHVMSVTIHPDDRNLVYVGSNAHGLWFSRDAGATWNHYAAFPFKNVQSINVHPDDHTKLYLTTFGGGVWVGPHLPPAQP